MTPPIPSEPQPPAASWSQATRIAFRFCLLYLGMYCVSTQIVTSFFSGSQGEDIPDPATLWPLRPLVFRTAALVFHANAPLSMGSNSGSGDCMFGWVLAFCLLMIAALGTTVWSLLDRKPRNYARLYRWFRLFVRFALAGQLINYGLAKVIPLQMPYPSLTRLLQPFGTFSPMGVLWSSIGAAQAYEIFAGCAEVAGGLLLVAPRTATLGALVCLADMIQVFVLNLTYDVPVKLFAFHLILLCCFLLAPDVPRLAGVLFLNRRTEPAPPVRFFAGAQANRMMLGGQILLGLWLLGMNCYGGWKLWSVYGGGRPHSPLYGIWEVRQMSLDGEARPPLLTDSQRWRRVVFDYADQVSFQRMDDTFANYGAALDLPHQALTLTRRGNVKSRGTLTVQRPSQDELVLEGEMDNHPVRLELHLFDRNKLLLVSRGFHWIQEYPFNR